MQSEIKIFVVLGRLGKNLSISKIAPITRIDRISELYTFRESSGFNSENKNTYKVIPGFILKIRPKVLSKIFRWFYEPIQLLVQTIKIKPQIINGVYTLPKGLNSFLISRICRVPCVISVIGGKEEIETEFRYPKIWKKLNIALLNKCEAITCKGKKDIDYFKEIGIDTNKVFVYNGGIDISRFNSLDTIERDIDIVFVGYFDANKGAKRVLQIVKKLKDQNRAVKVAFLGKGPLWEDINDEIRALELSDRITCHGYVAHPEDFYNRSKLFVLPSTNEGLSTAMLEAMACNCVPIVSDVGNMSEAVDHEVNGFLVQHYNDIDCFLKHVVLLLSHPKLLTNLSKNARNTVVNKYSYKQQSEEFLRIIDYLDKRKLKL